ncbi:MAG: pyrroline-5-carboxylate reductase [Alphaproteobacteria bacterium]
MSRVLLVGCGKMGGALLAGWVDLGMGADKIVVVETDPDQRQTVRTRHGVSAFASASDLPESFHPDVVVLAVKPQAMADVVPGYRRFAGGESVFLSIAAGKPIGWFAERLAAHTPIVRAMPNTPAAIRRGMTVACADPQVSPLQRQRCDALLTAVGEVAWVEEESLMDAVTAVSGSGPAYVFLLVEALTRAGTTAGLSAGLAGRLARATVVGSGALLGEAVAMEPATLRQNVTSPGGTTAAALAVLMAPDGLEVLMTRTVEAAARRSRELSG